MIRKYRGPLAHLRGAIGFVVDGRLWFRGQPRDVAPSDLVPVTYWTLPDGKPFPTWEDARDSIYATLVELDPVLAAELATTEEEPHGWTGCVSGVRYQIVLA